jgi:hypothetical protein
VQAKGRLARISDQWSIVIGEAQDGRDRGEFDGASGTSRVSERREEWRAQREVSKRHAVPCRATADAQNFGRQCDLVNNNWTPSRLFFISVDSKQG